MQRPVTLGPSHKHSGVWQPWSPQDVRDRLKKAAIPWCVVGGWALDLWLGKETRSHEDIEIAIPRTCFPAIRICLHAFKLFSVGNGEVHPLPDDCEPLSDRHQNWVLDEPAAAWRLDIFLEPGDENIWIYRRDETIRRLRSEMVSISSGGVPYLKPEGVLLFKARHMREKDQADFAVSIPLMQTDGRNWLKQALQHTHPGHPWLSRLG